MDHLGTCVAQVLDGKAHGTLDAAQVVIQSRTLEDKERGGDPSQAEFRGQVLLEELLHFFDSQFGLFQVEQRLVAFRFNQITHLLFLVSLYLVIVFLLISFLFDGQI